MSFFSDTAHNFETMLAGKSDFNQFIAEEGTEINEQIGKLNAALQPAVEVLFDSFKAGASALVGAGLTGIGPILSESTEEQATAALNLLARLGLPTTPPLNLAEQAALVAGITGLKAVLDRMGIHIMTGGANPNVAAPGTVR
jgi:hypothetical protein